MLNLPSIKIRYLYFKLHLKRYFRLYTNLLKYNKSKLNKKQINELNKNGYCIVNNYITKKQSVKAAKKLKAKIASYPTLVHKSSDERLIGCELLIPVAAALYKDQKLLEFAEYIYQERSYCGFVMGGFLKAGNQGSSGEGWHRDSFGNQFKSLLYLTDVADENGPFEIIPKSHQLKSIISSIKKASIKFMQTRLSDEDVFRIENRLNLKRKTLTGKAGTLILFNSSSIHRGKPIVVGERSSLTNYYFRNSQSLERVNKKFGPIVNINDVL